MTAGIVQKLIADVTIQTVIGQSEGTDKVKVFPGVCPTPEKYPYLIVRRTGKSPVQCKGMAVGLVPHTFEVIAYHKSYDKLDDIEAAIEAALNGTSGEYGGTTFKNVYLSNAFDADYIKEWSLHARVLEFQALAR